MNTFTKERQLTKDLALGTTGFEVEWCTRVDKDEQGYTDMDSAKYRREYWPSMEIAMTRAAEVYPQDQFGSVRVTPVELRDDIGKGYRVHFSWEHTGDPVYYEGPKA